MHAKIVLSVLFASAALWAQTAQINGIVTDSTGSAIPSVAIKATQTATGVVRTTNSGNDGSYVLPNLPIGPYMLEVTKEGFSKYAQTGVVLEVGTNATVDVTLKVGALSEQVTVEAVALQTETRTSSIGQVVDNARIMELPVERPRCPPVDIPRGHGDLPRPGFPKHRAELSYSRGDRCGRRAGFSGLLARRYRPPGPVQQP